MLGSEGGISLDILLSLNNQASRAVLHVRGPYCRPAGLHVEHLRGDKRIGPASSAQHYGFYKTATIKTASSDI
jgi:hypothetical protein